MKRLLALLLAMILFCCAAMAEGAEEGLVFEISGITICDEWSGETSDTHKWITVKGALTNWGAKAVKLSKNISAVLVFQDSHEFKAKVEFCMSQIEPLVQAEGALVFKVPNMVAEAGVEELEITLKLQGEEQMLSAESISRTTASQSDKLEGPGFDSPEAAVEAYMEAFNRGDLPGMLSTFAIESYVDHANAQAYIERRGSVSPFDWYSIPSGNEYHRNLKAAMHYGDLVNVLSFQYLVYNVPEEYADLANGKPLRFFENEEMIPEFITAMTDVPMTGWFGKIELIRHLSIEELGEQVSENYYHETFQQMIDRNSAMYGCDELREMPMLIQIDGTEYLLIMESVRYGNKWYNHSLTGLLSRLMIDGNEGGLIPFDELQ